ncbi:MAG: M61 family metallopeptidase [Gammaproteobacteria bacterium]|nr:M61 family metallopeptidase [Gammaproteobacteria bacterium]
MSAGIHYKITPVSPQGHRFAVVLTIEQPQATGQLLVMPAWIPGSYLVRDFAQHVAQVSAESEGAPVRIHKTDKSTWRLGQVTGAVEVRYEVYAFDFSVRGAYLDSTRGFFNGSSVFLCVEGQQDEPVTVEICAPPEDSTESWRVATTLPRDGASQWGFGHYTASGYEELIDHPVEMGHFELVKFLVAKVPHYFVLSGRYRSLSSRLARDAELICEQHVSLFGELPPMECYLFLTRVEGSGYGGLEHRSSCALVCSRHELPRGKGKPDDDYCRFLGLVSHEYFHLWNVKRIKPAGFLPYDLGSETYTRQLWVFEGVTSYYDDLALVRSGVIEHDAYLKLVAKTIGRVAQGYGRKVQSLADSSFDAWIKFYKPNANTPNSVVSYYTKGALVALALDLTIRLRTGNVHSLDHVMQAMWRQYGAPLAGVPEDGFEEMAEQVTGLHLRPFFEAMIRDVAEPPLISLFADVGLTLSNKPPVGAQVELGIELAEGSGKVGAVRRGSCGEAAGIAPGDELVAFDGMKIDATNAERLLTPYAPGDTVDLHLFRRDELLCIGVCLEARVSHEYELVVASEETDQQRQARRSWLLGRHAT